MSNQQMTRATARAGANIALIKYWGKRGPAKLNLPATGSVSLTLKDLETITVVEPDASLTRDIFSLNGDGLDDAGVLGLVDRMRQTSPVSAPFCRIASVNHFPTAAGLASSASGFAALVLAVNAALNLAAPFNQLAQWARMGSGSAARSLVGGFCRMHRGAGTHEPDHHNDRHGDDAIPVQLLDETAWPLEVVVAITQAKAKDVPSRVGMNHTMATSPYYTAWVEHNENALIEAEKAILSQDFDRLADLSEASAMQMHACALAAEPAVMYWNGTSVECLHAIRRMRGEGHGVFFTMDAGPQVKAICLPGQGEAVAAALGQIPGVESVMTSSLGPGAGTV
ncbi:MAG: diphosphomevalonate decarboxylase [Wenzhouxiangella sp.]|nr:diphosphomevalonate decarboxylase [Wenzhouxiangella sp.]